jgi:hypothetical protein
MTFGLIEVLLGGARTHRERKCILTGRALDRLVVDGDDLD